MGRQAFTLLELLVALALLVVVTGLALPALVGRMEGARLDAALRVVGAAVVSARAEAQERGEPVVLLAVRSGTGDRLVIESLERGEEGESRGARGSEGVSSLQTWAELPEGVNLDLNPPAESHAGEQLAESSSQRAAPLRLAIFLPDGAAAGCGTVYLRSGERTFAITLNRWTGGVSTTELDATQMDSAPESGGPGDGERKEAPS
jgi:prepilin-type N-terminal cleavage/methylation domain-containing protein